eukprot:gene41524-50675_t
MPVSPLLRQVADYCWSNKFLDIFRKYFRDHAVEFEGAPSICDGEHDMKYYGLFQDYLKLYEDTLEDYLRTVDVPIAEFYQEVRDAQHETHDLYISTFVDCLLASADYESFYKVMAKEGHRSASTRELTRQESKAEEKGVADEKVGEKSLKEVEDDKKTETNLNDESEKKSYK